jgi:ubiquitin C-terminal hydrolase
VRPVQADGRWLRFDDGNVTAVGATQVFHDRAYLLFYQRRH